MKLNVAPCSFLFELVVERKIWQVHLVDLRFDGQETFPNCFSSSLLFLSKTLFVGSSPGGCAIETQRLQEA